MSYWNVKSQEDAQHFIFGFGSIVNDESRRSLNPDSGDPIPVRISPEFGYKRMWNFQSSSAKLTALGLAKVHDPTKRTTINGIIYPVNDVHLIDLDEREEGYDRVEVPTDMIQTVNWQKLPDHEYTIWIYIPKGGNNITGTDLNPADKYYPILQTYIDVVLLGFLKYGENFVLEFLYTTGWWSKYWLNDRQVPRRPWLHQSKYKIIDSLLEKYSKVYGFDNNVDFYQNRKLPVEFSVYFMTEPCNSACKQEVQVKNSNEINFKCEK